MKENSTRACELLAPAGGPKQYIAAVENGADAIYLGGKSFNARMNADNFSDKEIEAAIDYGHLRGVKSFVTMNTLLRDEELADALEYAAFLYKIGADAVILQDLGLGYIIKQKLPDLPLHLSTQGSIYNRAGVEAAAALGYDRVVLARELSLPEIKEACQGGLDGNYPEIEVFVHGALCMCYSGQCHLSRYIGGRSGNRGGCAQPCRLPYQYLDSRGYGTKGVPSHPLSPKDLCLIEELGQLKEAGVTSLKIEGRMKSAEYVAVVTSIYRKYLDLYESEGSYTVSRTDWNKLEQIFNRGQFTQAYFYGDPGADLMCAGLPKHQGIKIGRVMSQSAGLGARDLDTIKANKANKLNQPSKSRDLAKALLVDVMLDQGQEISMGDGIEIHGKTMTGNVVTYLERINSGRVRVGDIKDKVDKGDLVYRLTSKSLMDEARATFEHISFEEGKWNRKSSVKAIFIAEPGQPSKLHIVEPLSICVEDSNAVGQHPVQRETTANDIIKQLSKTGDTPFAMEAIEIERPEPTIISMAGLNSLRRKALAALEMELKLSYKRNLPEGFCLDMPRHMVDEQAQGKLDKLELNQISGHHQEELQLYFYRYEDFLNHCQELKNQTVVLLGIHDFLKHYDEICRLESQYKFEVSPYLGTIEKEDLAEGAQKCNGRTVFAANIGQIRGLNQCGITVAGEPSLNIYNSFAFEAYRALGLEEALPSLETGTGFEGALPLMVTEHKMDEGILVDRKGKSFIVEPIRQHSIGENLRTMILASDKANTGAGALEKEQEVSGATGSGDDALNCWGNIQKRVIRAYIIDK